eukprot:4537156-Pyramimonas_sp.AAC.1
MAMGGPTALAIAAACYGGGSMPQPGSRCFQCYYKTATRDQCHAWCCHGLHVWWWVSLCLCPCQVELHFLQGWAGYCWHPNFNPREGG